MLHVDNVNLGFTLVWEESLHQKAELPFKWTKQGQIIQNPFVSSFTVERKELSLTTGIVSAHKQQQHSED